MAAAPPLHPRRFFNTALRDACYRRCVLPTLRPYAAAHAAAHDVFDPGTVHHRSGWSHTCYTLPAQPGQGLPPLDTRPFRNLVDFGGDDTAAPAGAGSQGGAGGDEGGGTPSDKRAKVSESNAISKVNATTAKADAPEPAKKHKVGKRARPCDGVLRTYKILMRPTGAQRREIRRWQSGARMAYNTANRWVKEDHARPNWMDLRARWYKEILPSWFWADAQRKSGVPRDVQSHAIKELVKAYEVNLKKQRMNPRHIFNVKYRSFHDDPHDTIQIERTGTKSYGPLKRFVRGGKQCGRRRECLAIFGGSLGLFGGVRLRDRPRVIERLLGDGKLEEDAKIMFDKRCNRYYLIFTYVQPHAMDPAEARADDFSTKRVVALDPGTRPFQEWYSPTERQFGELVVCGGGAGLYERCAALDNMHSEVEKMLKVHRRKEGIRAKTGRRESKYSRIKRRVAHKRQKRENARLVKHPSGLVIRTETSHERTERRRTERLARYARSADARRAALERYAARARRAILRSHRRRASPRSTALPFDDLEYLRFKRRQRRRRKRWTQNLAKARSRLRGWVEAAHYDAANFLLRRFDVVVMPKLQTSMLVLREGRNIHSKAVRAMLTWSHYKFRQRLTSAAARYPGRHVIESNEPGTSKTCGMCGQWKANLGAGMVYSCTHCAICIDRQVNGARNNFLAAYGNALRIGWDGRDDGR